MRFIAFRSIILFFLLFSLSNLVLAQSIPSSTTHLYKNGISLYDNGQFEEAKLSLHRFKQANPEHELLISQIIISPDQRLLLIQLTLRAFIKILF